MIGSHRVNFHAFNLSPHSLLRVDFCVRDFRLLQIYYTNTRPEYNIRTYLCEYMYSTYEVRSRHLLIGCNASATIGLETQKIFNYASRAKIGNTCQCYGYTRTHEN